MDSRHTGENSGGGDLAMDKAMGGAGGENVSFLGKKKNGAVAEEKTQGGVFFPIRVDGFGEGEKKKRGGGKKMNAQDGVPQVKGPRKGDSACRSSVERRRPPSSEECGKKRAGQQKRRRGRYNVGGKTPISVDATKKPKT